MSKLLSRTLRQFILYAAIVLLVSVPVYYLIISRLWEYELAEHNIILTDAAGREDTFLIIGAVTSLTVVFFLIMLGGFVLINRRISKTLWRPFYQSLEKIRNFQLDNQEALIFDKTDIAEFSELNQSLDRLISGNVAAFRQQKEFAENASHELQTPLSVIQSKLEMLIQSSQLQNEQFSIIEDTLTALARVSRINKNLLLLTKIGNSQYMDEEQINLSALVNSNLDLFTNFIEDKHMQLARQITENVQIRGNRILIEILVNNLVTNAIRYSNENTVLQVVLSDNSFQVCNTGAMALNSEGLFKRFSTGSLQSPGTGLGLALVKQISLRYGWEAGYNFRDGHHVFNVRFSK